MGRVVIITGEYPPVIGGIGDYTSQLMNTEEAKSWILFYKKRWNVLFLFKYIHELLKLKPDYIFMQYPARGYAWSFSPYLLSAVFSLFTKITFIPVLHEYSQLHFIRKMQMNLILFTAKKIIVTNSFEKEAVINKNKKLEDKIKIIKILSNTNPFASQKNLQERYYDIAYFGLISRNKGIEVFIDVVEKYKHIKHDLRSVIIGGFPNTKAFRRYSDCINNLANDNGIETILNKPLSDISKLLNDTKILLLPFPDGCSERRGSYISGLKAGCVVITRKGEYTTDAMFKSAFFSDDAESIIKNIDKVLFNMTEKNYIEYQNNVKSYLSTEFPLSWNEIAKEYSIYCHE